jgi:NhaP-type Na+/H+ or K+/H+ antiporter
LLEPLLPVLVGGGVVALDGSDVTPPTASLGAAVGVLVGVLVGVAVGVLVGVLITRVSDVHALTAPRLWASPV